MLVFQELRGGALWSWAQTWEAVLPGARPQRKCIKTVLGLLKEARGWNQLLLQSYCWVGTEMNSKQNRKKEVPSALPSLVGPHLQDLNRKRADKKRHVICRNPVPALPNGAQKVDLESRDNNPAAKWDPKHGNPCAEPEAQGRAQLSQDD